MLEIFLAPTGEVFVRKDNRVLFGPTHDYGDNRALLQVLETEAEVFGSFEAALAYVTAHDDDDTKDAWLEELAFAHKLLKGRVDEK